MAYVSLVVDERASSAGKVILLDERDGDARLGQSRGHRYPACSTS